MSNFGLCAVFSAFAPNIIILIMDIEMLNDDSFFPARIFGVSRGMVGGTSLWPRYGIPDPARVTEDC
jgi:hypothetical protein